MKPGEILDKAAESGALAYFLAVALLLTISGMVILARENRRLNQTHLEDMKTLLREAIVAQQETKRVISETLEWLRSVGTGGR